MATALTASTPLPAELKLLRQQLVANPADLETALQLADGLIACGRPAEAVQLLTTRTRDPGCRQRLREYLAGERELSLLQRLLAHGLESGLVARVDRVVAQHLAGDFKAAIALAQDILRDHPEHAPASNHLGRALFNNGDAKRARTAFERAIALQPTYAEACHNLAQVLRAQGDHAGAEQMFRRALELAPAYRSALLHIGITQVADERLADAMVSFERLLQLNADHAGALLNAGTCCLINGDHQNAQRYLTRAALVDPRNPMVYEQLADLHLESGDYDSALRALRKILELVPDQAGVWAGIAYLQHLLGNPVDASNALNHGLSLAPEHPMLQFAAGRLARQQGRYADALARLRPIKPETLPSRERGALFFEQGICLDQDGQTGAAINAFERANAIESSSLRARICDFEALDQRMDAVDQWLDQGAPAASLEAEEDQGADLCFMLGFPLASDVVLNELLHAHPAIVTMRQPRTLDLLIAQLNTMPGAYPGALATLNRSDREQLKAHYRAAISAATGERTGTIMVELDPVLCSDALVLHRLFPKARFVLFLRHPCDAVLANFMFPHVPSTLTTHFYTLEETARVYAKVMRLWQRARSTAPGMPVSVLRYETLISDPQGALQPICEFLGLPWTATLRDVAVATPLRRGTALWERYRTELQSVLPLLKPVAERLGYVINPS